MPSLTPISSHEILAENGFPILWIIMIPIKPVVYTVILDQSTDINGMFHGSPISSPKTLPSH